jgi:hypothetical protein
MIDFLFIQLYIKKKYNKKVEDYFSIGKQSVSDWRTNNTIPPKRLLDFYNNEGTMDIQTLFENIYKI